MGGTNILSSNFMLKIFLSFAVFAFCQTASAEKLIQGSLAPLKGQTVIDCTTDFDEAEIGGLPLEEFIEYKSGDALDRGFEKEYHQAERDCWMKFVAEANDRMKNVRFARKADAPYQMTIKLITMDKDGRDNVCHYIFTEKSTGEIIAVVEGKNKGGRFGSFTNLMGDAFEFAGSSFGPWFSRQLRKL